MIFAPKEGAFSQMGERGDRSVQQQVMKDVVPRAKRKENGKQQSTSVAVR